MLKWRQAPCVCLSSNRDLQKEVFGLQVWAIFQACSSQRPPCITVSGTQNHGRHLRGSPQASPEGLTQIRVTIHLRSQGTRREWRGRNNLYSRGAMASFLAATSRGEMIKIELVSWKLRLRGKRHWVGKARQTLQKKANAVWNQVAIEKASQSFPQNHQWLQGHLPRTSSATWLCHRF